MNQEKAKKKLTTKMTKMIDRWELRYNFGSIYYCLDIEGVSLEQCATCYFFGESGSDEDIIRNIEKATKILVTAGLYDYEKRNYAEATDRAMKCIEEWNAEFGNVALLHMTLISILKSRDFFSESLNTVVDSAMKLQGLCQAVKSKMWIQETLKKKKVS